MVIINIFALQYEVYPLINSKYNCRRTIVCTCTHSYALALGQHCVYILGNALLPDGVTTIRILSSL